MDKSFDELLKPVREDIDRIDKELLPLFVARMECSSRVAEIKEAYGIPVFNPEREAAIIERVRKEAGEMGDYAALFYEAVMDISKKLQEDRRK